MNLNTSSNISETTDDGTLSTSRLLIGMAMVLITTFTIIGNTFVLVAIKREPQLQTKFNIYIINLAVTDLTVALTAMSFYTTDNILGYWPFGEFLCGVWIFNDYGMTFASVFTLIVISVDRFWAVTWPNHYKSHHTRKKCKCFIVLVWVFMVVLWLPACLVDRFTHAVDDVTICIWDPALNNEFVFVIAILGHHGCFIIIAVCYARVFFVLRKNLVTTRKIQPSLVSVYNISQTIGASTAHPSQSSRIECDDSSCGGNNKHSDLRPPNATGQASLGDINEDDTDSSNRQSSRERRAFVTLTYIIVGYVICWFPFHIVFDVMAIKPEVVPHAVYQTTFWLTYVISAINPFLYNFSNTEFRKAFKRMLVRTN